MISQVVLVVELKGINELIKPVTCYFRTNPGTNTRVVLISMICLLFVVFYISLTLIHLIHQVILMWYQVNLSISFILHQ